MAKKRSGKGIAAKRHEQDVRHDAIVCFVSSLEAAEVQVPESWRVGTTPDSPNLSECFYRSYRYVADRWCDLGRENLWLVHGEYSLGFAHAWVELFDRVVFDGVLQRFYDLDRYYKIQSARPWYKYEPIASTLMAANAPVHADGTKSFGDWHIFLKLPFADPSNPTIIGYDRMRELLVTSGLRPDLAGTQPKVPKKRSRPRKGSGG
jgi:hypothetical protein